MRGFDRWGDHGIVKLQIARLLKKHIASLAMYMSMLPQGSHINKGLATVVIAAGRGSLWMVRPCATAPLVLAFVAAFLQVPAPKYVQATADDLTAKSAEAMADCLAAKSTAAKSTAAKSTETTALM